MIQTEMEENIVSLLGGRVAEKLILNDISTGASNDIERASKIARDMVTKYGMSEKIGSIMFGSGQEEVFLGRDFAQSRNYSEETAGVIDEEIKAIIDGIEQQLNETFPPGDGRRWEEFYIKDQIEKKDNKSFCRRGKGTILSWWL